MDRAELERLDRESLVMRAQAAGIRRARVLTRPELIDELLRLAPVTDHAHLKKSRGFFGIARDLLSRVVERGLHLPDAADRLRAALGSPFPQVPRPEPQAVPTVTLAEIYAAQGHKLRAVETLWRVLEAEPDHGAARALLEKLEAVSYVAPPAPLPPEHEVPGNEIGARLGATPSSGVGEAPSVDAAPLEAPPLEVPPASPAPEGAAVQPAPAIRTECVAIPLEGNASYVWWRLAPDAQRIAEESSFFVRAVILVPTWDGPQRHTRDVACDPAIGELVLRDLPEGAIARIAIGVMGADELVPLAHSPALETSPSSGLVRWTPDGAFPIALEDPWAASIARAAEGAARASGHFPGPG
jgi:hypothetical protein